MQNNQEDLLLSSFESYSELYFHDKCKQLLKFSGKENLCEYAKNLHLFEYLFTSNVLSTEGINHALLKKYYLSSYRDTRVTRTLDEYINEGKFSEANEMLNIHPSARSELLSIYIDNIDIPNTQLMIENGVKNDYATVNNVLQSIDNFYQGKRQKESVPFLKKTYK